MDLNEKAENWAALRADFRWQVPKRYNIASATVGQGAVATPNQVALLIDRGRLAPERWTYRDLEQFSGRFANLLTDFGVRFGDRVAVLLDQRVECALTHLAAFKLGAISVTLFKLFGPDALLYRLAHSGAKVLVTDEAGAAKVSEIRDQLPELERVITVGRDLSSRLVQQSERFSAVDTLADDPAVLMYTSGTTGPPKGVLHAHRVLLGHLPGVQLSHRFLPKPDDLLWTPADWAWIGGLFDVLMPGLALGVPVLAKRFDKFTPEAAYDLMSRHKVRNAFLPPTVIKQMISTPPNKPLGLRSVASGGETLNASTLDAAARLFGCPVNEFYGQTEHNMMVSNSDLVAPPVAGSMGQAVPGHDLRVVDPDGEADCKPGEVGEIWVAGNNPVQFLRYWKSPEATAAKFARQAGRDWLKTGDLAEMDAEGRLFYQSRDDDVITSAGYRIGPSEIESCLIAHPAVIDAAVVGLPDSLRTENVVAFVEVSQTIEEHALITWVATRLSPHLKPREVRFVERLPRTSTGKLLRRQLRQDGNTA